MAVARRVVLTGGPCGGKTTVQSVLTETFERDGWKVYHVPETATILLGGGVAFTHLTADEANDFQENLLKTMMSIEKTFFDLADIEVKKGRNAIVICDRGAMDPSAYMEPEAWNAVLKKNNFSDVELRDARYDCVVHLVSAAIGAEAFYGSSTNAVRAESLELARILDQKTANAWIGHPYFDVVDNSTDFQTKLQRIVAAVKKRLQIPDPRTGKIVKRKFLLTDDIMTQECPVTFQDFDVQHDYLVSSDGVQTRLRKRGRNGVFTFTVTSRLTQNNQRVETRRDISYREYELLLAQRDPATVPIKKNRRCLVWQNQCYQIDTYISPHPGLTIMEAYINEEGLNDINNLFPSFLKIEKEVTKDPEYSMFSLSMKDSVTKKRKNDF